MMMVARDRPAASSVAIVQAGDGFGFPSGHPTGALVVYGALRWVLLSSRYRGHPLCLPAAGAAGMLLVGAAAGRVMLGEHWPTDVLGAALLAVAWLIALRWGYLRLGRLRRNPTRR